MTFTQEEENFLVQQQDLNKSAKLGKDVAEMGAYQQAMQLQERDREKGIIKEQLDLSQELNTIEHLLRGHILMDVEGGGRDWVDSKCEDLVVLTDYGIYLIINTIMFYLNKNTLLSNYDEETIRTKMEDFGTDLADTIFMEYEKVFKYPSFEDCANVLIDRINKKTELRMFALKLIGKESNEKDIEDGFIREIESDIDREITKIKEQIIKNKLKRFLLLMRQIIDSVHSTYLRAYNGIERRTLRQHIHVSENVNPIPMERKPNKMNPLNWRN